MEPIIKITNLNKIYNLGKLNEFAALKNINLEIYPGEYVTFFGPSGCGKSTLLYTIAGLEFPTSGEVMVNNKKTLDLKKKALVDFHRYTVGMVFQAYYLVPHLNILNNIMLPRLFSGGDKRKSIEKASELMTRFGLGEVEKRKPAQLSGGQQQRVAIARALVNDPIILLADEPVGNLDTKNSEIVLELIDQIHTNEKKTIIHVSHNPKDLRFSDRIFYMVDGQIEKVVINKKSPGQINESEADMISKAYPYLNNSEIEAKLILNHVISDYSIDTQQQMEAVICKYIKGNITKQQLIDEFDKPAEKGGFDLYKPTARKIGEQIGQLVQNVKIIEKDTKEENIVEKRVKKIKSYLCDKYDLDLNYDEICRFEELLTDRLAFKLTDEKFDKKILMPWKNGGLGINKRTIKKICREIKLVMFNKKFRENEN